MLVRHFLTATLQAGRSTRVCPATPTSSTTAGGERPPAAAPGGWRGPAVAAAGRRDRENTPVQRSGPRFTTCC